ncbi:MAG: hypothetical protein P8Y70_20340 [Candidatus Lokiarchaeota archaeon]|jgi:hypothetical protein
MKNPEFENIYQTYRRIGLAKHSKFNITNIEIILHTRLNFNSKIEAIADIWLIDMNDKNPITTLKWRIKVAEQTNEIEFE